MRAGSEFRRAALGAYRRSAKGRCRCAASPPGPQVHLQGHLVMAKAMAVKDEGGGENRKPEWLTQGMGWGPRKFAELKSFFTEVRTELKKVTWPSKREVY